jgi:hypothetical protein
VGEEFEHHLDQDLKELEMGHHLLTLLKSYQESYEANITAIVSEVMQTAASDVSHMQSGGAIDVLDQAKAALVVRLGGASTMFFAQQTVTVTKLVQRLAAGAKEASQRREDLQGEILHSLHDAKAGADEGLLDDAGWGEGLEGGEEDDHWAKETERWHNETVATFFRHFEEWLHPQYNLTELGPKETARLKDIQQSSQAYTNTSMLFLELKRAKADLDEDVAKWHDIQDMLHTRKADLTAAGLEEYKDADEPEDDGYQGFQSWHVQSYLEDCLWPANLRANSWMLLQLHENIKRGVILPIDAITTLEDLAAENAVPHHWLHHHAYYYGGRDDYF